MRLLEERKEYSLYYNFESYYDSLNFSRITNERIINTYLIMELKVDNQFIIGDSIQIKDIPVSYELDDNDMFQINIITTPYFDKKLKILSNRLVKKFKKLKRR